MLRRMLYDGTRRVYHSCHHLLLLRLNETQRNLCMISMKTISDHATTATKSAILAVPLDLHTLVVWCRL